MAEDATRMSVDSGTTIGGRFRSGMSLFDGSLMLAEFLSSHSDLAQVAEVKELMGEDWTCWKNWKDKTGIELGAGLGLPSIVASNLGAKMVATDGDEEVLHLLDANMAHKSPSCRVVKLFWGSAETLPALGLNHKPDFLLAANVVYYPEAWDALLDTLKTLSGSST